MTDVQKCSLGLQEGEGRREVDMTGKGQVRNPCCHGDVLCLDRASTYSCGQIINNKIYTHTNHYQ
jgi:hypothetical protein